MSCQLIKTRRFSDDRGWFTESYNTARFADWGVAYDWCQDNHSLSRAAGTLRGLHFQHGAAAQAKLVRCLAGRIYDVAVDLRAASPTYKQWIGVELSAENGPQLLIPKGFAHGFLTLTENCEVAYKVDAYYAPESDGGVAWDDPDIGIAWPFPSRVAAPLLSEKDAALPPLAALESLNALTLDFAYDGVPLALTEIVQ